MTDAALLAGLVAWAAGAIVDLGAGAERTWARLFPYAAGLAGGGLVTLAGARAVLEPAHVVDLGTTLGFGPTSLRMDPLAGLFLTLTAGLAGVLSACLLSWARPPGRIRGRGTGAGYLLVLGAVTIVVVAGDAFTFLFAWESLTLGFFVLSAVARRSPAEARASWTTLGVGKAGGAALLLGFLLLAGRSGSYTLASWSHVGPGPLPAAAYALVVVGFGAKVGLVPFQVWLPVGYPAAPGPTRAAMAGLAANAGFYGLWRFLAVLGPPPVWLAVAVLVLGGGTALLGVVFSAVQSSLNRVIAYSSVENAGIILVGYGVALAGSATHHRGLVAIGLLAASLQVLAHAVAKSGLFASAAFFESDHGTDHLEALGGIGRRHPLSGTTFSVAALTLAGMPPTIGFVSEWMILESLMQDLRVHALALRLAMATAGALVALTAGVAALTFIRLIGLMVLGRPVATPPSREVHDGGLLGGGGLTLLAASCLGLAAAAPWVVRFISAGLAPIVPRDAVNGALKSPWVLQPVYANFSILSPSWLFVAMPVGIAAVAVGAWALSGGTLLRARRVPAWRSASQGVTGPDRYSAFGYANVLRHVLGNILGTSHRALVDGETQEVGRPPGPHVEVRSSVVEPVEAYLYRPALAALMWAVRGAKRLQCGRLDAYVGYMLGALLVVLAVVATFG